MARRWRVYHTDLPDEDEATVELTADEAYHVTRVLRLQVGDPVALFDGRGLEREARLVRAEGRSVGVRLGRRVDEPVEATLDVRLFQASGQPQKIDWIVQKATELGVSAVTLVPTRRSERGTPRPARLERWQRIAVEACKQCGRRRVPVVCWVDRLPAPPEDVAGIVLDARQSAPPLGSLHPGQAPGSVWIVAGPEAGLDAEEIEVWQGEGWQAARLGPRVLRTETAGVIAAALVAFRWGDLGGFDSPTGPT